MLKKLLLPSISIRVGIRAAFAGYLFVLAGVASAFQSGVVGTMTVSPSCPGPQRLDDECESALVGIQVRLADKRGRTVGSAQTSAKGEFEIAAPPGTYLLEVSIEGRLPRCPATSLEVTGRKKTTVRISCDSGMR